MVLYAMLSRELANLSKCLLHIIRLPARAEGEKYDSLLIGYKAHAQTELGDIIHKIKRLCAVLGLSFEETVQLGNERGEEKEKQFSKRYPEEKFI
jgi:hypothetical protein